MVIECVAAAAAVSVVITALYGAQARRLFHAFVRSSLHLFYFLLFGLFFLIFGLSLPRALDGGGDGVWDQRLCRRPTPLMGRPLVDDHLIYCNITHTRTINERRRPKWRTKGEKSWTAGCFSSVLETAPASSSRPRRSETIDPRINRTNWVRLARTNVRISLVKRNGHEIAVVLNRSSISTYI